LVRCQNEATKKGHGRRNGFKGASDEGLDLRGHFKAGRRPGSSQVFADKDHPNAWFDDYDPEGVAFEYPDIGEPRMIRRPIP
jgi:hypothetical protein